MLSVEKSIAFILLLGILTSAVLVIIGGCLYLSEHASLPLSAAIASHEPPHGMPQVLTLAFSFSPLGFIELGLLCLVLTQFLRVAFLTYFYARKRDGWFTFLSAFILFVLIYSLVWRH